MATHTYFCSFAYSSSRGTPAQITPLQQLARRSSASVDLLTGFLISMHQGGLFNDRAGLQGPPLTTTQGTY